VRLAVSIGDVITNERLRALPDHRTATEFLRQATHALAVDPAAGDCR
jgi:hypothetical protein